MTVIKNLKNNKSIVTVVCCLHGDEIFGLRVFEYFQKCIQDFSGWDTDAWTIAFTILGTVLITTSVGGSTKSAKQKEA